MSAAAVWGSAKWNWEPQGENEIAVRAGERVEVLDADDDAWWHCRHHASGAEGWLPSTHLIVLSGDAGAPPPAAAAPASKTDPDVLREYLEMLEGPADDFSVEDLRAVCDEEGVVYQAGATKPALIESLRNYLLAELGEPPSWAKGLRATSPRPAPDVVAAPAPEIDDSTRNEYREMIEGMDADDAREICVEEGLKPPAGAGIGELRQLLLVHFKVELPSEPEPEPEPALKLELKSEPQPLRAMPPPLPSKRAAAAPPQPTLSGEDLQMYLAIIDELTDFGDIKEMCDEEGVLVPAGATVASLKDNLRGHYSKRAGRSTPTPTAAPVTPQTAAAAAGEAAVDAVQEAVPPAAATSAAAAAAVPAAAAASLLEPEPEPRQPRQRQLARPTQW